MPLRVLGTEMMNQVTGKNSRNDTAARWGVYGTDLGHMFWHRDRLYMVFGDTFGAGGFGGKNWRSNVMARIADPDPRHGFPFESMITGPDGAAKELIRSRKIDGDEKTVIPTQGISLGGRIYLHYMSVRHWGLTGGNWTVGHSGLAYSDDDGQTWAAPAGATWREACGFEQVAFIMAKDGFLYSFGIPEGRFGGVRLRRVGREHILTPDAYEYWDGTKWEADPKTAAVVVPAPAGELSVAWSEPHHRWLMMYLDETRRAVVLRTATTLTGPWSDAQEVVTADQYPGLYAPYIVPGTEIDGDLYYTMSQWGPYNVFLMHTSLEPAAPAVVSDDGPVAPVGAPVTPVSSAN
ncbi:DUF4185 domain-containing protein [Mesorhizobium captivum]|uniref:DUF4185 domain-containing protein n=1 Tax=Mesorhizobium captivum TaxID=3072319 RepID=UPI002A2412E5|nr:DUF4185 domain-containing protein [Mesorhizobium sp. VK3C]MDX8446064.1 DUF4185 domain-containing protein [Mesorhizobium sp. VK3C]